MLAPQGKQQICSTPLSYYDRIASVGNRPIYLRYNAVRSILLSAQVSEEELALLAEPVYDNSTDALLWYAPPFVSDYPRPLSELTDSSSDAYRQQYSAFLERLHSASMLLPDEERSILQSILVSVREEYVFCYDGRITLVAWGMHPIRDQYNPHGLICVHTPPLCTITLDFGEFGGPTIPVMRQRTMNKGSVLNYGDLPEIRPLEGYRSLGWYPVFETMQIEEDLELVAQYEPIPIIEPEPTRLCHLSFSVDERVASLSSSESISIPAGDRPPVELFPQVYPESGYIFSHWMPDPMSPVEGDCCFIAVIEPEPSYTCTFDLGEHGSTTVPTVLTVPSGSYIPSASIPAVEGKSGYTFGGWDSDPTEMPIHEDKVFVAKYKRDPWYVRFWRWLCELFSSPWMRRLLWALAILLGLLLLFALFRSCDSAFGGAKGVIAEPRQSDMITMPDGRVIDDNGAVASGGQAPSIIQGDGTLPEAAIIPPIVGADGVLPPIESTPNMPDVIANRLNIYFEEEHADIDACAKAFKELYPGDQYRIIGADREVKWLLIQVPEAEREAISKKLPEQLSKHRIFVVDESLFGTRRRSEVSMPTSTQGTPGWHLQAVQAQKAWQVTKGDSSVRIAVIDDGLEISHPIFSGRQIKAYNVFTQSSAISRGDGHGTHVAGIALGGHAMLSKGAAGIAPNCPLTIVQVSDNETIPFSALANGVMYALNHDADVVNISIGADYSELNSLPEAMQQEIARTRFKNEERVWNKIYDIARKRQAILVFGVGNSHLLAGISPMLRSRYTVNVAAVDQAGQLASWSNYGQGSNISAPGVAIYSSMSGGKYELQDGTSMSAPIVTGAIALMRSVDPKLDVERAIAILQATGRPTNRKESPMIQIADALAMLRSGKTPPPRRDPSTPEGSGTQVTPPEVTDREAILRMIQEYERKIAELKSRLN